MGRFTVPYFMLLMWTTVLVRGPCDMFITRNKVTVFIWFTYNPALKLSGIVLKMASLIREGTLPGMKPPSPLVSKPPSKILIIPADEVVQVIAKVLTLFFFCGWD